LPEVGDRDKPKLVFFFDEAHLLFAEAPRPLLEKVEQVVRLVRSKGVGVYFVTQNPLDIPDSVLGQLGNRVQHALRAFTPRDQKAVKAAAQTMRANPAFNVETAISELGVGEALVSMLDEKGRPSMVERGFVVSPGSRIGPIDATERKALIASSVVAGVYDTVEDRESAYELLTARAAGSSPSAGGAGAAGRAGPATTAPVPDESNWTESLRGSLNDLSKSTGRKDSIVEAMAKSAARSIGSAAGRELLRGVLGTLLGGGSRRR
jgi:DNA helicase HerA-like ATPase